LSADGSKLESHWQVKAAESALADTFTALATQAQWLDPVVVTLLRCGQGRGGEETTHPYTLM
jgi:hypothetical protein